MLKKTTIFCCGLMLCALAAVALAQGTGSVFTGTVETATSSMVEGKFEILLQLKESPEKSFFISLEDAPKFGLTKGPTIPSGEEFGKFLEQLDALKGRQVKLTVVKMPQGAQAFRVTQLERL